MKGIITNKNRIISILKQKHTRGVFFLFFFSYIFLQSSTVLVANETSFFSSGVEKRQVIEGRKGYYSSSDFIKKSWQYFHHSIKEQLQKAGGQIDNNVEEIAAAWQITVNRIDFSPQPSGFQMAFRIQLQCSAISENACYNSELRFPAQSPTYFTMATTHPAVESFSLDSQSQEWVVDLQDVIFAGTAIEFDILAKSPNHITPDDTTFEIDARVFSDNAAAVAASDSGAWSAAANLGVEKYLQFGPDTDALLDIPVRYYLYPCDPSFDPDAYGHLYLANWTLIDELPADVVYNNSSGIYDGGTHTVTWSDTSYIENEDCDFMGATDYWVEVTFPSTIFGEDAVPPVLEAQNIVTFEGYPMGEETIMANRLFDSDTLLHGFGLPNPIGTHTKTAATPYLGTQDVTYAGDEAWFYINIRTSSAGTTPYYFKIIDPLPCLDYTPNAATQYESQNVHDPACGNPAFQPTDNIRLELFTQYLTIANHDNFINSHPTIPLAYLDTNGDLDTLDVPFSSSGTTSIIYEISWAEVQTQIGNGAGISNLVWDSESIDVQVIVTADNLRTAARMSLFGTVAEDTPTYPMLDQYRVRNYAYFYVEAGGQEDSLGFIQDDVIIDDEAPIISPQKSVSESSGLITLSASSVGGGEFMDDDTLIITDLLPFGYTFNRESQQFIQIGDGTWSWSSASGDRNLTTYPELDDISVRNFINVEIIDNYNNTGRQLVRASFLPPPTANIWKDMTSFRFSYYSNESPMVYAAVNEMQVFPTNPISVATLQCQTGISHSASAAASNDPNDLDGDGVTSGEAYCLDAENVTPPSTIVDVQSYKAVRGDTGGADFEPFPAIGDITAAGGTADFQINLKNTGGIGLENLVIYDVLPHIGDTGLSETQVSNARGSAFDVTFAGIDMGTLPTGTVVEYSTSTNACRDELTTGATPFPTGCVNDWTTTVPSPLSSVKSLRFTFPSGDISEFIPGEGLSIEYAVGYPSGTQVGEVAWNTFAYAATRSDDNSSILPTEPPKVGITIPQIDLAVTKSVDPSQTYVGQPVTYTLFIDHEGAVTTDGNYTLPASKATNISLNDNFRDMGLSIVPNSVLIAHTTSGLDGGVTFDTLTGDIFIPEMGPEDSYEITYAAFLTSEQSVTNTLEVVTADVTDIDSTPGNDMIAEDDQDEAMATWVQPEISLRKLVETQANSGTYIEADATDGLMGLYHVGEPINYRFIIKNTGSTNLTSVALADSLTGFLCNQTIGTLTVGDSSIVDCTWSFGFVDSPNPYVNIATATGNANVSGNTMEVSAIDSASVLVVPPCDLNIQTTYSENCQASGDTYTADWKVGILVENNLDDDISYQRNSDAIQTHTLTGTTDTLTITGIPADGGVSDTLKVWLTNDVACADTVIVKRPVPCPANVAGANSPAEVCQNLDNTKIGGTVFEDWNYDGDMNQSDTIGVQGVQVYLYDDCGNVDQTTYTDSNGNYEFSSLTDGTTYRVEFSLPESVSCWAKPTKAGADNGTTVQFVQPGNCASLGLAAPAEYCETNPFLMIPCYLTGTATSTTAMSDPAIVKLPFLNDAAQSYVGTISDYGVVNGLAWQSEQQRLFTASFLKRYSGFADGPGYVYVTDDPLGSPTINSFDLQNITPANGGNSIDLGSVCRRSSTDGDADASCDPYSTGLASDYTLVTDPTQPSVDLDAFLKVGAMSYGDVDYDADNETLWLVNLYQRALISVDVSGTTGSLPGTVNQYLIDNIPSLPSCSNGVMRPFGLKIHRGRAYLGLVCDASISQNTDDLVAYVLSFDVNNINLGFTTELSLDLDYVRETTIGSSSAAWHPWAATVAQVSNLYSYPQPILSDIEFTTTGDMLLGFMDRSAHQGGLDNYEPISGSTTTYYVSSGGDLLKACNVNGTYMIEGMGACSPINDTYTSDNAVNNDGPAGGGEFFFEDYAANGHNENNLGALAYLNNIVVSNAFNPNFDVFENGLQWYNTKTGLGTDNKVIVANPGFPNATRSGKGSSLGDIELLCGLAPIEIGNYVWEDTDGDGIQDACESPIENVILTLYNTACEIVAIDTTDANGQYYFNDTKIAAYTTQSDTILAPNTTYHVVITGANGGSWSTNASTLTIGSNTYDIALANQGNNDLIDSDAAIGTACGVITDFPFITANTGDAGCVDHSLDFGFILEVCPPEICLPVKTTVKRNNGTN